jgi:hypothetical protein
MDLSLAGFKSGAVAFWKRHTAPQTSAQTPTLQTPTAAEVVREFVDLLQSELPNIAAGLGANITDPARKGEAWPLAITFADTRQSLFINMQNGACVIHSHAITKDDDFPHIDTTVSAEKPRQALKIIHDWLMQTDYIGREGIAVIQPIENLLHDRILPQLPREPGLLERGAGIAGRFFVRRQRPPVPR